MDTRFDLGGGGKDLLSNPEPYTLHPTPCTVHRTPYTLHPAPYTLHRFDLGGGGKDLCRILALDSLGLFLFCLDQLLSYVQGVGCKV